MQSIVVLIAASILIFVLSIYVGLFLKGIDRKAAAYYQSRIGPSLRQPFWDLKKLMLKQTIIPENAVGWIFKGAPAISLVSSAVLLIYIVMPYFMYLAGYHDFFLYAGDIILVVYLLMIPAIAMVAGGFASGSPYASIGAQREMVILMTTELPLAIIAVAFAWKVSNIDPRIAPFALVSFSQHPLWIGMGPLGIMGGTMLAITMAVIIPAELAKIPFDQAEAETEIADGLLAEYSGKYLAFFHLADAVKVLAITSLAVILFFPQGVKELCGCSLVIGSVDLTLAADILLFLLKHVLIYFFTVTTVRIAMARFKISHVARIFVIGMTATSLAGFFLIYLDTIIIKF
ncbi:MAG: formate hydrogenlyase subunit 4 [Spirochaetae bacterium HGW-Spirochaetae-1]|jgi:formate hydrogenlyase subunit 4|nr:MAG: formate hydrogenlyase subunit 4 [Spirochaetae bacterium HGW-Spirochaetae-1]